MPCIPLSRSYSDATYQYDINNNLLAVTDGLGNATGGDPSLHTIHYQYDSQNRQGADKGTLDITHCGNSMGTQLVVFFYNNNLSTRQTPPDTENGTWLKSPVKLTKWA